MDTKQIVIDITAHKEIVQCLSEKVKTYYIFPDIAQQISTRLQKHLADGEYSNITNGNVLSKVLTEHIQEINQDKHLRIQWSSVPLPDHQGPMDQNQEWLDEQRQQAKLDNYGLHKMERLPGNVGYLDIHAFYEQKRLQEKMI